MAPPSVPLPPLEDLLAAAPECSSLAQLARRFGRVPNSFTTSLKRENLTAQVKAALAPAAKLDVVEETEEERSRVDIAEQRAEEAEAALRKQRKLDTFDARVINALEQGMASLKPRYRPRAPRRSRGGAKHEMALLWSDTHYPELVSLEETNGINQFDPDIMWKRHDVMRERIASHLEQRTYEVDTLHVWALGDMLSGNIHEELAETNDIPLAEATIQFAMDGAEWLSSLLDLGFRRIKFTGVVGNHPRFHKKPRAKQSFDNADWIAYHTMRLALRNESRIEFDIPKASMWPVMVAGNWRVLLWHGDGVRSTMPGVPWGGVNRRAAALQDQYTAAGKPIDYFCVGHFHQVNDTRAGKSRVYMNGSVKGPDEYSIKMFGGGAPAEQLLLTFHPRHGSVGPNYLNLENVAPAGAPVLEAVA